MDPNPSYRTGPESIRGGLDITISLTPGEAQALGTDAADLADWFDTALWAIALLRTGLNERGGEQQAITPDTLYTAISDLDRSLIPRLQGARDAIIRLHQELGGSIGQAKRAMDVAKSTAQSRRNAVTHRPETAWELWATKGGPDTAEPPSGG